MGVAWGLVMIVLSVVCWGGQLISWLAPRRAMQLGLLEQVDEVEPAFWTDARAEAFWDVLTLWTMPVAGVLLVAGNDAWAYFGLAAGAAYVYFAGRGIVVRQVMRNAGLRIGDPTNVKTGFVALALWGVMAFVTMAAAVVALEPA